MVVLDPFSRFLLTIGVGLFAAKVLANFMEKHNQPGVLGEIGAGVILGPYVLKDMFGINILDFTHDYVEYFSHLGIIFLIFLAGLGVNIDELKRTGRVATMSTLGGVFVPLILGYVVARAMGYDERVSLVIGVLLTATSIGVTVRTMMDLGVMTTEVGTASLSASVMDDFLGLALIMLAVGSGSIVEVIVDIIIFLVFVALLGVFRFMDRFLSLSHKVHTPKAILAFTLSIIFILSAVAEVMVSAAIEGAFFAGILMSSTVESRYVEEDIKTLSYGLFIPLFFVYTGSTIDPRVFLRYDALMLALVIVVLAIVGKVVGRGVFARIAGFNWRQAIQMGVGSIPRMEVAIVSAMLAIKAGAIPEDMTAVLMAAVMVFVTVTTFVTPPLLKLSFKKEIEEGLSS